MKHNTPLKASFAVLAVAASLMSASTSWADQKASRDKVNAARRAELVKRSEIVAEMCDTIHGWNIKTPDYPSGADECKNGKGMDCEMPLFTDDKGVVDKRKRESFRASLTVVRKACDDGLKGLTVLAQKGAALFWIPKDEVWDPLIEGLGESIRAYNGQYGDGTNYKDSMKAKNVTRQDKDNAILQLVTDETSPNSYVYLVTDATVQANLPKPSTLQQALKAIEGPKKADGK